MQNLYNQDCARAVLMCLDQHFFASPKRLKPVRITALFQSEDLSQYDPAEIARAAQFLVDHHFVDIAAKDPKFIPYIKPEKYRFLCVTGKGREYLQYICDNTSWAKCKKLFPNVLLASIKEIAVAIGAAAITKHL